MDNLKAKSYTLRRQVLDMVVSGQAGHIGGDYSVMDILVALYNGEMHIGPENQNDPNRDYFVLSKGHSVEALYAVLADRGFFPIEDVIQRFSKFGSPYIGHPNNKLPGIEMNSGSLGHGLPVAIGMALANRMSGRDNRVYVVMGDGELAEGSVWEGAMAAGHYHLSNLLAVVDRNRLQISGSTETVMAQDDLAARFSSFGWNVLHADGHDYDALRQAFAAARAEHEKPSVLIADTIKGYGASIMEGKAPWHHKVPTEAEYAQIAHELEARKEQASHG